MTKGNGIPMVRLLVLLALLLGAAACSQQRPAAIVQIAKSYGLDSFGQIEGIRYTFNAQFPGVDIAHPWEWNPKTGTVSFKGKDKDGKAMNVTYQRSQLSTQDAVVKEQIDPSFVNDNYWFLFPFHAYWDNSAQVEDTGMQKLPLGQGTAEQVAVKYPSDGGYTPGDTWTLFVGPDHRVQEFTYHRGGSKKPSVVNATWGDYKMAGPLLVAMDHRGTADGAPLRVFFSDVAVKLAGSDAWLNAQ